MQRTEFLSDRLSGSDRYIRNIGLEEAFYVWRIIQPSLYHKLYKKPKWKYNFWTKTVRRKERTKYNILFGFNNAIQNDLSDEDARKNPKYEAGGYLRKTQIMLHIAALLSLLPIYVLLFQAYFTIDYQKFFAVSSVTVLQHAFDVRDIATALVGVLFVFLLWVFWVRLRRVAAKRKILEDEFLSINSCAILWRLVATAHSRAIHNLFQEPDRSDFSDYTINIIREMREAIKSCDNVYEYISQK